MEQLHNIIRQVEAYAEAAGVKPDTVCRAATKNPRLFERLKRRAADVEADIERLEKWMRDNPVNVKTPAEPRLDAGAA